MAQSSTKKLQNTSGRTRLNKFIADCGIASRRKADELIDEGLVKVNGKTVYELGIKIDPENDRVTVKGKAVKVESQKVYVLFFKPRNVVTSMSDPQGRPTVADYFRNFPTRLFPVGRLDWDTEGLLLMTNDGDFSQEVTHPKGEVTKTYLAKLDGVPSAEQLQKLTRGVSIVGGRVAAKSANIVRGKGNSKKAWVKIVITEGKNRQVRRMFEKIGFDVEKLQRTAIGKLTLGALQRGDHRVLAASSLKKVFEDTSKDQEKDNRKLSKSVSSNRKKSAKKKRTALGRKKKTSRNPSRNRNR